MGRPLWLCREISCAGREQVAWVRKVGEGRVKRVSAEKGDGGVHVETPGHYQPPPLGFLLRELRETSHNHPEKYHALFTTGETEAWRGRKFPVQGHAGGTRSGEI